MWGNLIPLIQRFHRSFSAHRQIRILAFLAHHETVFGVESLNCTILVLNGMTEQIMIKSFRDKNLKLFYMESKRDRAIPATIERQLAKKLDMLAAAHNEQDLFIPTSNYYKRLSGQFDGLSSMRVNIQWRLMFQWKDGYAENIYLDPHQDT